MGDISFSESSNLCRMSEIYADGTGITKDLCLTIQNSIFNKGLSLVHQDFIKSVLITLLDYFSRVPDMNATIPKNGTTS